MRQSSASAARVSFPAPLESAPERMRLQRVVANAPGLGVPSFAAAEFKDGDSSQVRLVKQGQKDSLHRFLSARHSFIIARRSARQKLFLRRRSSRFHGKGAVSPEDAGQERQM